MLHAKNNNFQENSKGFFRLNVTLSIYGSISSTELLIKQNPPDHHHHPHFPARRQKITKISCVMPVSAMLMTGGVVFYNYFCVGIFYLWREENELHVSSSLRLSSLRFD
jgi:hypothetical protein